MLLLFLGQNAQGGNSFKSPSPCHAAPHPQLLQAPFLPHTSHASSVLWANMSNTVCLHPPFTACLTLLWIGLQCTLGRLPGPLLLNLPITPLACTVLLSPSPHLPPHWFAQFSVSFPTTSYTVLAVLSAFPLTRSWSSIWSLFQAELCLPEFIC